MSITMEELFDLIHRKQAEKMLELLAEDSVSPQALNAINKYLSDNGITGVRGQNAALTKLSDGLAAFEEGDTTNMFPSQH